MAYRTRRSATPNWVNPYAANVVRGRVDQGVDYIQSSPYRAPAAGTIVRIDPNWYRGTPNVYEQLDQPVTVNGRSYPGVYFGETSVLPGTHVGQRIAAGQPIAGGSAGGGLGEQGFARNVPGAGWMQSAYGTYNEGEQTQAGKDWVAALGGAATPQAAAPAATGGTVAQMIAARAQQLGVDPRAALAVAGQEGLGGGIGDYGTSFGPFQLHYGGAYPSWAPRSSQGASQAWAQSPQGINYALNQIAGVARGQTGQPAVNSIVYRFERPQAPGPEAARAWANYAGTNVPGPAPATSVAPAGRTPGATMTPQGISAPISQVPTPARPLPPAVLAALRILRA